ncbi:IclR family transcriptional regulator [Tessaracoccus antarcticus]|nr:IclR family transcriptional regulator [Tessaracoccus antarcticus]
MNNDKADMATRPAAHPPAEREKPSSLTMLKGLRILEHVATQSEPLAVGDVASALDLDKSTVSRLLAALRTAGYVRQAPDRRYQLTSKLLFLTRNFRPAEHLRDIARAAAQQLHEALQETVHVASISSGEIVFVDFLESPHAVRIQLPTVPSPLHVTAIGRAALSRMSTDDRLRALHESAVAAGLPLADVDTAELRESLTIASQRGYATYNSGDEVIRVAAAITNETGEPVGGISVSGPAYRIRDEVGAIGQMLVTVASGVQG